MPPENCLKLLDRDLKKKKVTAVALQPNSAEYPELIDILNQLSALPSWGNARDIKTMAKSMIGAAYKAKPADLKPSPQTTVGYFRALLTSRNSRDASTANMPRRNLDMSQMLPPANAPTGPAVQTRRATKKAPPKKEKKAQPPPPKKEKKAKPANPPSERDAGVTDAVWNQLQADRLAMEQHQKRIQEDEKKRERELKALEALEAERKRLQEELAAKKAKDEAEMRALMRKREEARIAAQNARIARERAEAEAERRRQEERRKAQEEAKAQEKLRHMGVCCAGFRWIKQSDGYRCAGGSHFVSNLQLGV